MEDDSFDRFGIHGVSGYAEYASSYEKKDVKSKDHNRDPSQPVAIVRKDVEEYRNDASSHNHGEPPIQLTSC